MKPWPILFSYCSRTSLASSFKKARIELEILMDICLLLTVWKCIKDEICHAIRWYTKPSKKLMKDYDNFGRKIICMDYKYHRDYL